MHMGKDLRVSARASWRYREMEAHSRSTVVAFEVSIADLDAILAWMI
jgi:hypothetical protein